MSGAARAYLVRPGIQLALGFGLRAVARRRTAAIGPNRRGATAAALALLPPAAALLGQLASGSVTRRLPVTAPGRIGVAIVAVAGAGIEELAWRGPLTYVERTRTKLAVAAVAVPGFAIAHLPRDPMRWLPLHVVHATAWSCAAGLHRSIAWPWFGHACYNAALFVLSPRRVP